MGGMRTDVLRQSKARMYLQNYACAHHVRRVQRHHAASLHPATTHALAFCAPARQHSTSAAEGCIALRFMSAVCHRRPLGRETEQCPRGKHQRKRALLQRGRGTTVVVAALPCLLARLSLFLSPAPCLTPRMYLWRPPARLATDLCQVPTPAPSSGTPALRTFIRSHARTRACARARAPCAVRDEPPSQPSSFHSFHVHHCAPQQSKYHIEHSLTTDPKMFRPIPNPNTTTVHVNDEIKLKCRPNLSCWSKRNGAYKNPSQL